MLKRRPFGVRNLRQRMRNPLGSWFNTYYTKRYTRPGGQNQEDAKMLTNVEQEIIDDLANEYNKFVLLPSLHPWHNQEFMHGIHRLQHMIMARPYFRQIRQEEVDRVNSPTVIYREDLTEYNPPLSAFVGDQKQVENLPPITTIEP